VAKYAPGWASPGSVVDSSYEALDRIARSPAVVAPVAGAPGVDEPPLCSDPPPSLATAIGAPEAHTAASRDLWLMHPFALGAPPPGRTAIGVFVADFHRRWPWSAARWRFVAERMAAAGAAVWWADAATLAALLATARSVQTLDDPHVTPWLRGLATLRPAPRLFADPAARCGSFSQFWNRVTKRASRVQDLPGFADPATMP
jgi:deoxyribodipyrimidine photo-lyase